MASVNKSVGLSLIFVPEVDARSVSASAALIQLTCCKFEAKFLACNNRLCKIHCS